MSFGIRRLLLLIFSYIKFLYFLPSAIFVQETTKQHKAKSLLIIKLDEIGDYILFRNLLKYFRTEHKYKDYDISMCGNIEWKNIYDFLDNKSTDSVIWVSKKKFSKNLFYRMKTLKLLSNKKYDLVVNCTLSRNYFVDDEIVKVVNAKSKIGNVTDLSNQFNWQKKISDKYYSELISISNDYVFEFHRNKIFISKVLTADISEKVPSINKTNLTHSDLINKKYAAFSLGGKNGYKIWDTKNFIAVANHIKDKYKLDLVLLGAKVDEKYSKEFEDHLGYKNVLNFVSKTTLIEALNILSNADIFISNDSGLAHIAAALNTKVIVIANGTHFGRFFPYPKIAKNVAVIYPPQIQNRLMQKSSLENTYKYRSKLKINDISHRIVIDCVDEMLGNS